MLEYPRYAKVLFCTDFSENADCAFQYAFGIAKRDDAMLCILHVMPSNPEGDAILSNYASEAELVRIHEEIRKNLVARFNDQYLSKIKDKEKVRIITKTGNSYEEILKFASQEDVDLIVMGTHGKTGLEHVFLGNVAEKVGRYSPIPVLMVPCKKRADRKLFA